MLDSNYVYPAINSDKELQSVQNIHENVMVLLKCVESLIWVE